jgi:hypothetical protein
MRPMGLVFFFSSHFIESGQGCVNFSYTSTKEIMHTMTRIKKNENWSIHIRNKQFDK